MHQSEHAYLLIAYTYFIMSEYCIIYVTKVKEIYQLKITVTFKNKTTMKMLNGGCFT